MRSRCSCLFVPLLLWAQPPSKKITRAADVPQFQYAISGKVEDIVRSEEAFRPLGVQIRKNIESVLRGYDIGDAAARRDLLRVLATLDFLENRDADARKKLDELRSLEEKPAAKLMGGRFDFTMRAILDGRNQTRDRASSAYRQAVYDSVRRTLDPMPYDVVRNDVGDAKASLEISTEAFVIGRVRSVFDPVVGKTGGLSSNLAHALPGMRWLILEGFPLKATLLDALGSYLAAHTKEKKDIWTARNVDLEPGKNYTPVKVAVWDGGVDIAIFGDQVAKDSFGQPALIAYDMESRRTTGTLLPLTLEQARRYPEAAKHLKGMSDMQANLDTSDASELRKTMDALTPEQTRPFQDELSLFRRYVHGTHVAGILMAGNPYARLVVGRGTGEYRMVREFCPSAEWFDRAARANHGYVGFFKAQGVRVVNMSWGGSPKDTEAAMEQCGIGKPGDDRKQIAIQWFETWKKSLEEVFRSAPEILFIAADAFSNSNAGSQDVPASLRVPNLLTVGAVDVAGDEGPLTSYFPTVGVYANGYDVERYIPGGGRLKLSGTSMAAPNGANLAAKILAVNPKLTPPEVIALVRQTADKTEDSRRNLIHPKKALAAAATRIGIE